jgi:hypothetical protein
MTESSEDEGYSRAIVYEACPCGQELPLQRLLRIDALGLQELLVRIILDITEDEKSL